MFDLSGKTALVTGGGRGLGLEMAKALARCGARVFINGRDAAALAETVATVASEGIKLEAAAGDVQTGSAEIVADVASARVGSISSFMASAYATGAAFAIFRPPIFPASWRPISLPPMPWRRQRCRIWSARRQAG